MVWPLGITAFGLPDEESASTNFAAPKSTECGSISAGRALPWPEPGRSNEQSKQPSVGLLTCVETLASKVNGTATERALAAFTFGGASLIEKVRSWNGDNET